MEHNITSLALIDLETVTGDRTRDPSPTGDTPTEKEPNKRVGGWLGMHLLAGPRGDSNSEGDSDRPQHRSNGPLADRRPGEGKN